MEELLVNPTILEMTKRRADLDLDGISYIIIRYGLEYQAVFNYRNGHVSVGIESDGDAVGVVTKILEHLDSPAPSPEVLRRPSRIAAARTKQHRPATTIAYSRCTHQAAPGSDIDASSNNLKEVM
jgi:hypothetical protein